MKTPEEIKKNLEWLAHPCTEEACDECGYTDICDNTYSCDVSKDALAYIEQLEERITLMLIQMKGDCGTCKHRLDERKLDDKQLGCRLSPACYECLKKDGREMWEYEGLPEL